MAHVTPRARVCVCTGGEPRNGIQPFQVSAGDDLHLQRLAVDFKTVFPNILEFSLKTYRLFKNNVPVFFAVEQEQAVRSER